MKIFKLFLKVSLIFIFANSIAANSGDALNSAQNSFRWETVSLIEGGFEKRTFKFRVKKSTNSLALISVGKDDYTIAFYDIRPECDRSALLLSDAANNRQNKCRLRIKIDDEVFNLSTYNNFWFAPRNGLAFKYGQTHEQFSKKFLSAHSVQAELYDGKNYFVYDFLPYGVSVADKILNAATFSGKCVSNLDSSLVKKIVKEFSLDLNQRRSNNLKINIISLGVINLDISEEIAQCLQIANIKLPNFKSDNDEVQMFEHILEFTKASLIDMLTDTGNADKLKIISENEIRGRYLDYLTVHFIEGSSFASLLACGAFGERERIITNAPIRVGRFLEKQAGINLEINGKYFKYLRMDADMHYSNHQKDPEKFRMSLDGCRRFLGDIGQ